MSKPSRDGQYHVQRPGRLRGLLATPQRTGMLLVASPLLVVVPACSTSSGTSEPYGSGRDAGASIPSGGTDRGGGISSGGASSASGSTSSQAGGQSSGGSPTAGQPSGGMATAGQASGGTATGGLASRGSAVGGQPSGGSATGGQPSGGSAAGGQPSGGSAAGGQPSGGSATGGQPSGGSATGGQSSGGSATGGGASDPFSQPETCTSGTTWRSGTGPTMRPGEACISCHSSSGGPSLAVAGTVYPTAHEPDDCNGAGNADAVVVITDANGQEHMLSVNQAGNFTLSDTLALPYTAKVVVGSASRAMGSSKSTGDCNSCHTQSGSNGAPGRIVLP